ncbi:hypothetical protein [uncultured Cohaesibacter sp.]|uniref:hypothetical protein n=1 Tax=uncultured Cohaesibacter sp. TaxID=1002546 RepID=UPI002AA82807|nr:hypothetical protein [uncultured Cohaesibacter sp.]
MSLALSERNRIEEEQEQLRAKLKREQRTADDLSESQIWYMATLFFVGQLREQASRPWPDTYTQERAEIELRQRQQNYPAPQGFLKLQQLLHAAMIEAHKRSMIEHFPGYSINLDPRFSELTISTKVNPGSSMVLEDLAAAYEKDPARGHVSPKTKNKHDTRFRIVREFFGKHTKIDQTAREETRAFRNLRRLLPKNTQKHFPGMDVKKAAKAGPAPIYLSWHLRP